MILHHIAISPLILAHPENEKYKRSSLSTTKRSPALHKILFIFFLSVFFSPLFSQVFSEVDVGLNDGAIGDAVWGDIDNDQDLDIIARSGSGVKLFLNESSSYVDMGYIAYIYASYISISLGDYNSDGFLDIVIAEGSTHGGISKVYKNNRDNTFTELSMFFEGVYNSSVDWGDYDNDGDLDIILSGENPDEFTTTKVYRNSGNDLFVEQVGINIINSDRSFVKWSDYDADGDLDVILSGTTEIWPWPSNDYFTKIFTNLGDNTFVENPDVILTGVKDTRLDMGDYDNDGDQDILLTGFHINTYISKVFAQEDDHTFEEQLSIDLVGVRGGSALWGDYDNDGDLDILLTGGTTRVYRNDGGNVFSEDLNTGLPDLKSGAAIWGDFDNDNDLDVLTVGIDNNNVGVSRVYLNNSAISNTIPNAPSNCSEEVIGKSVSFKWNRPDDNESSKLALSYNLCVTRNIDQSEVFASMSDSLSGYRRLVERGNILDSTWTLKNLPPGEYSWRVQAIDNSFEGSLFSDTRTFTIDMSAEIIPGEEQVVLVGTDGSEITVNESSVADSRQWFYSVVPGGPYENAIAGETGISLTSNFDSVCSYYVVCASQINGTLIYSNEVKINVSSFIEQEDINLAGAFLASADWGDYNDDQFLDILISGRSIAGFFTTKIYTNNNGLGFEEYTQITLPTALTGDSKWVDIDNDGDLDILINGHDFSKPFSKIYENNDGQFYERNDINILDVWHSTVISEDFNNDGTKELLITGKNDQDLNELAYYSDIVEGANSKTEVPIPPFSYGDIDHGDFDNDGDFDLVIVGTDYSGNVIADIYLNDGGNNFSRQDNISLPGGSNSLIECGDFNSDGYFDILIAGWELNYPYRQFTHIYKNEGGSDFSEQSQFSFEKIHDGCADWGDYNNDGRIDVVISGETEASVYNSQPVTKVYTNNDTAFNEAELFLTGVKQGTTAFADYDNDNDLDLLIVGKNINEAVSKIYKNHCTKINSPPSTPFNLKSVVRGDEVTLSWDGADDMETPNEALTYNMFLRKKNDSVYIVSPLSHLDSGKRKVVDFGNCLTDTMHSIFKLDTGIYYWSVQSIDNGYAASSFAEIDSFKVLPRFSIVNSFPQNNSRDVAWIDYDNDKDLDIIVSGDTTKLYKNIGNGIFEYQSEILFPGISSSIISCADYDNDNYVDLLFSGNYSTSLFRNNSGLSFTNQTGMNFRGFDYSNISTWGDYDNDGDLDLLIAGWSASGRQTDVYCNNGDNSFTLKSEITFEGILYHGIQSGDANWIDFDNDQDLDIFLNGTLLSELYSNEGNGEFNRVFPETFGKYQYTNSSWADFDNDHDPDLLFTGSEISRNKYTKIYRNDQDSGFIDINAFIRGIEHGDVGWGDYNCDGNLDILLSGWSESYIGELYTNNGVGEFIEDDIGIKYGIGDLRGGDYDNDGDTDILGLGINISIISNNGNWDKLLPKEPTDLRSESLGYGIEFFWNQAANERGGTHTYNLRVGKTMGGCEIVSPMSDLTTGQLFIPQLGNCNYNMGWHLDSLPEGTYYWSVQAIDQSFSGGEWAPEQTFTITVVRSDFEADTVCLGSETNFTDLTLTSGDTVIEWKWDFGDGNLSTTQNPKHIYALADTFDVTLIAISTQYSDTITKQVIVKPKPTANFAADLVCQGTNTQFVNSSAANSLGISSWNWDFGDGTTSNMENPIEYRYFDVGDYSVQLIASADNGCADTIQKTVSVAGYPSKSVSVDGALQFCAGDSVILTAEHDNLYDYQWLLGGADITGADSSKFKAIESGDYSIRITNTIGLCVSTSDNINVTVALAPSAPTITTSGTTTFCAGDSVVLSVTNNPSYTYQWKYNGGADGSDTSVFVAKNSGSYSLEVTNSTGCSVSSFNQVAVTVYPSPALPTVDLSGPSTFCEGNSVDLSVISNPAYTYQWKNSEGNISGQTATTLTASTSEQYYLEVTSGDGCIVETLPRTVTVNPVPVVPTISASSALDFCEGDSVILSVTDNADYIYQWKQTGGGVGNDASTFVAKTSGTYTVEVSNAFGCDVVSANHIEVSVGVVPDLPAVELSGPSTFCEGNSVDLSVISNPAYTYQWKNSEGNISGQTATTLTASTSEQYYLEVTSGDGCIVETLPRTVTVNPVPVVPTISASSALDFCEGDSVILSVTDNADYIYQWKQTGGGVGNDASTFVAKTSGTYTVEVSNAFGCDVVSVNHIEVSVGVVPDLPAVELSGPSTFCEGNSVDLSVISNPAYTYQWKNSEGNISGQTATTLTASTSEQYYLEVTSGDGCIVETLPRTVTVNPVPVVPTISASSALDFCEGDSVILSVTDNADYIYQWKQTSGGVGNDASTFVAKTSGTYTVEVSNAFGCDVVSANHIEVSVGVVPDLPAVELSGPSTFCEGNSVDLSVISNPAYTYQWKNSEGNISGQTATTLTASTSEQYYLEVTSGDGCIVETLPRTVTVNPVPVVPTISASSALDFCEGDSVILSVTDNADYIYQWKQTSGGVGNDASTFVAKTSGTYTVEVSNAFGCDVVSANHIEVSVGVVPDLPAVELSGPSTFCEGNSVDLSVISNPAYTYQWKNSEGNISGQTATTFTASTSEQYYLEVKSGDGCIVETAPRTVTVLSVPVTPTIATSTTDLDFCEGDSVILSVPENTAYTYLWKPTIVGVDSDSSTYIAKSSGTYSVEVTNDNGCTVNSTNQIDVSVVALPELPAVNPSGPTSFCEGGSVELSVTGNTDYTYQWKNSEGNISGQTGTTLTASTSEQYYLEVKSGDGCIVETVPRTVTVNPVPVAPTISATTALDFCAGDSVVLSVTDNPNYTYQWRQSGGGVGADASTYIAKTSGMYNVDVTNDKGCTVSSTNQIDVTVGALPTAPTVDPSGPTTFCQGGSVELSFTSNPLYTYQWKNSEGNILGETGTTLTASTSEQYYLEVKSGDGCIVETAPRTVTVLSVPVTPTIATSSTDLDFCAGDSVVLSVTDNPNYTYQWKNNGGAVGSDNNEFVAKVSGEYSLEVSNGSCFVSSINTITVNVSEASVVSNLSINGSTSFCEGDSLQMGTTLVAGNIYQWFKDDNPLLNATTNLFVAKEEGTYKLGVSSGNGCTGYSSEITALVLPLPPSLPIATNNASAKKGILDFDNLCVGDSVNLNLTDNPELSYQWKLNDNYIGIEGASLTAKSAGVYTAEITNNEGCSCETSNSISIDFNASPPRPILSAAGSITYCEGDKLLRITNYDSENEYSWILDGSNTGNQTNQILLSQSGTYQVEARNDFSCMSKSEAAQVTILGDVKPEIELLAGDTLVCPDVAVILSVKDPLPSLEYQWQEGVNPISGALSSEYNVQQAGVYAVQVSAHDCDIRSDFISINFKPALPNPTIIAEGPSVWYLACSNDSAEVYRWYYEGLLIEESDEHIYVANQQLGKYRVEITDDGVCYSSSETISIPENVVLGIDNIDPWENLKIYPNPTPGLFTLEMDNAIMGELMIDIFGETGARVINIKFEKVTGFFRTQIDLSEQPAAVYLIGMELDRWRTTRRLVVE